MIRFIMQYKKIILIGVVLVGGAVWLSTDITPPVHMVTESISYTPQTSSSK